MHGIRRLSRVLLTQAALWVLLCLLLCACQGKTGEDKAQEKSFQPEPSAQPKTSVQPEQPFQLQDLPTDDTHDGFWVDTGGVLGALAVTVEWDEEHAKEGYRGLLRFSVWNPQEPEEPIQTMTADSDVFHWNQVTDADFDGYQDFGYMILMGNQPEYWRFWIWDEQNRQFREETEFCNICCPEFYPETETIHGWHRDSVMDDGIYTIHRWLDKRLVCVRRIEIVWDEEKESYELVVKDRLTGQMTQVYRKTFAGANNMECLEEVEKWQDPDYHGEQE